MTALLFLGLAACGGDTTTTADTTDTDTDAVEYTRTLGFAASFDDRGTAVSDALWLGPATARGSRVGVATFGGAQTVEYMLDAGQPAWERPTP